ncbi:hypothetical protein GOBAR_AA31432 [Gossypium barbadense]|uniref:Uncharacterized protein n=1 Tax=Gossypium barbadense TaxID=3634 RepID=A0A2P5WDU1_GOSBA|nr:hypothetical protein GOBAR_AA31432 [Gossypium barbadense]
MPIFGYLDGDKAKQTRSDINNTGMKRSINGGGGNSGITNGETKSNVVRRNIKTNELVQKYLNIKMKKFPEEDDGKFKCLREDGR